MHERNRWAQLSTTLAALQSQFDLGVTIEPAIVVIVVQVTNSERIIDLIKRNWGL